MNKIQKWSLGFIFILNAALWGIPSNILKLVVKGDHVLFNYYSMPRFISNFTVSIISIFALYVLATKEKREFKMRIFRVITFFIVLFLGLFTLDTFLRYQQKAKTYYVGNSQIYHRPPNKTYQSIFHDKPDAIRSYPNAKKGYNSVEYTLKTDENGFRNDEKKEKYDILLLGDSFTEGSKVSGNQVWGRLVEKSLNQCVYNLGMSGSDPFNYLSVFTRYGQNLNAKTVICMIYEGNDFRRTYLPKNKKKKSSSRRGFFERWVRSSPIRNTTKAFLIKNFSSIGASGTFLYSDVVSWLPITIKDKNYAFPPKRISEHYLSQQDFIKTAQWKNSWKCIDKIRELCQKKDTRFIVVFAPTKPHITIPLARKNIPPKQIHQFVLMRPKGKIIPKKDIFFTRMLEYLQTKENTIKKTCEEQKIEFVSLTEPLRTATLNGIQTYYTYDQHWTPDGHQVVAKYLLEYFQKEK